MFLLNFKKRPITFSVLRETVRRASASTKGINSEKCNAAASDNNLESLIETYNSKLLYNCVIFNAKKTYLARQQSLKAEKEKHYVMYKLQTIQPIPISLKYISDERKTCNVSDDLQKHDDIMQSSVIQFPFNSTNDVESVEVEQKERKPIDKAKFANDEIRKRSELSKNVNDWMTAYDNFDDTNINEEIGESNWKINYGTPDPSSRISNVPCGGCGALLHCKDTAIPGYIPSEIFKNSRKAGGAVLEAIICQRCYFLKHHNIALQVRVSAEDYPKVLTTIRGKRALVVVMVDLLDFPCSIWPGIADILGTKTPILIVGNKVDLLPKDDSKYLTRIKQNLLDNAKIAGFATSNIKNVSLISAKSGYGIEELITSLQSVWKHQGDVYLVGCTNVGKSTLFNAFLQSDYCKSQASDLIQRATTSQWPGTTLNLLKFPITRPSGMRLLLRHKRLKELQKIKNEEEKVRTEQISEHNSPQYATLVGHIGQSYSTVRKYIGEDTDAFSVHANSGALGKVKMGINEKDPVYALSRWCYDTPGVVQPDQILNILTTEELMLTIPKQIIRPQTFCVKPGSSLFIAGLARLDYTKGNKSIRLTVFRSNDLPITICNIEDADNYYAELLGTDLLKVPIDNADRLKNWPGLALAKTFSIRGTCWDESSKDVVLSTAGWIAVNCGSDDDYHFQAWTPEMRGVYIRECLLPKAVQHRGPRVKFTPAYKPHKFI